VTRDRRLGRGLAALLGQTEEESSGLPQGPVDVVPAPTISLHRYTPKLNPILTDSAPLAGSGVDIPLDKIDANPFQPRRDFDPAEIKQLSESLEQHQLIQPILVRKLGDRFELIAGERRVRAARELGWSTISAVIRECSDRETAEIAIVENLLRKDLNPIEKARSFERYLDEHNSTQEELAKRIGVDRTTIANLVRLLELPEAVQEHLVTGKISAGHAKSILSISHESLQHDLCSRILGDGLSVRETERLAQAFRDAETQIDGSPSEEGAAVSGNGSRSLRASQLTALNQEFRRALGAKVEITTSGAGKGKIVIHFASHEEFERLRAHLTDSAPSQARAS
jgi:ParB family transcriptional regulator, chromosome partitioning protein